MPMSNALIEQLEFLRSVIFPAAYNIHSEYFPGLGACRICGKSTEQQDQDIYIVTQKRVLELHDLRKRKKHECKQ
jgi:hypothetical protein